MMLYLILGGIMLVSMFVQSRLKSKFAHYSNVHLRNGMSGKEIAEKMLADHGIHDVKVISVEGQLTDHYNPMNKTVNLSESVYMERNAAAAAVAAHECGHAVQHAVGYSMLQLRSKLVLLVGVILFAMTTLFAFVTLPVEYDASNRAMKWLKQTGTITREELEGAEDSLKWAARTYLVAALGSLAQLLYYVSMFLGSNKREE